MLIPYTSVKWNDWNDFVNAEYNNQFSGLDDDDEDGREAIYESILQEQEAVKKISVPAEQAEESAATRMKAARQQFTRLVRHMRHMTVPLILNHINRHRHTTTATIFTYLGP